MKRIGQNSDITPLVCVWSIWFLNLSLCLWMVHRAARWFPWSDDWSVVPYLSGARHLTWSWLWAQHNEHRIPLPKLLWFAEFRLSAGDFRAGVYVNMLMLGALAAIVLAGVRKLRGHTVFADAVFPVALLSWEQGAMHWDFQAQFCISTVCCLTFVMLVAVYKWYMSLWPTITTCVVLYLLPLTGVNGLLLAVPLSFTLLGIVVYRYRGSANHLVFAETEWSYQRYLTLIMLGSALLTLATCACWFIHYVPISRPHPGIYGTTLATIKFTAAGLEEAKKLWPLSGLYMLALIGVSAFCCAESLRLGRQQNAGSNDKRRWIALIMSVALATNLFLAVSVGYGRGALSSDFPYDHYATLSLPILIVCLITWVLLAPRSSIVFKLAFAAVIMVVLCINERYLFKAAESRKPDQVIEVELAHDLKFGVPSNTIAARYVNLLMYEDKPELRLLIADGIDDLRRSGFERYAVVQEGNATTGRTP
jgi:hypothetical protein